MVNIFGILTAIVLLFTVFVAYKNKGAYEERISETAAAKADLAKSEARLNAAQTSLKATTEKKAERDAEIAKLDENSGSQQKIIDDLKLQIEAKNATIAANKVQLAEAREGTQKLSDVKQLAAKMREVSAEREAAAEQIAKGEAKLANLTAENTQAENQANVLRSNLEAMGTGQSLPTLNTRIRSIYPTWGFVTLAAGHAGGVVANTKLNVVRNDQTIAQLLVTSVERGAASASIIPDSVAPDVTLMTGDRVVAARKPEKAK